MDALQLKEEIKNKKQLYNSIKLDRLPDKGARLKSQIDSLESALKKLSVDECSTQKGKDPSEENCKLREAEKPVTESTVASKIDANLEKSSSSKDKCKVFDPKESISSAVPEKNVPNATSEVKATDLKLDSKTVMQSKFHDKEHSERVVPEFGCKPVLLAKSSCTEENLDFIKKAGVPSKSFSDIAVCSSDPRFLSFADLKSKQRMTGIEPSLVPKSPSFSQYRSNPERKIKYTEPIPLSKHLLKDNSRFVTVLGSCQQYDPKLAEAKKVAVVNIHNSLVTCPSELDEENDPTGLKTHLMKHQKQALAWLLWRETQEPCGGIFADDMGLGKTLSMIALILKTKEQNSQTVDESVEKLPSRPTLIVCLPSILHQWNNEINKHCKLNTLKVLLYHGAKRDTDVRKFYFYDVVLTTYNLILSEGKAMSQKNISSPLFLMKWNRVILDEAHTVKNPKSQTAQWIFDLQSESRWAVTGTPIHNDLKDLYCLLKYLRCRPFDDYQVWKKLINDLSETSEKRRNVLMKSILLRRCKDQKDADGESLIPLPAKHYMVHKVQLSEKEMDLYDKVYSRLKPKINNCLLPNASKGRGQSKSKNAFLLIMLLKLQQCCNHPCLVKSSTEDESDTSTDSISDVLNSLSSLQIDDNSLSADDNSQFNMSIIEEDLGFPISAKSAKISKLLRKLPKILEKKEKVVIVSQWVSMLDVVSYHLEKAGILYQVIKGSTKPEVRSKITEDFNSNPEGIPVLLLSLKAGGVGLNLVGGNHMFLLDLHWNPALEMQAADRIYRVGQKHECFIHKFVCQSTIEEKIFDMQKHKKRIAATVLEGAKKEDQYLTVNDLKQLFST